MSNAGFMQAISAKNSSHFMIDSLKQMCSYIEIVSNDDIVFNLILQCLFIIVTLHKANIVHQNSKVDNFWCIKTDDDDGYYHYIILGKDYYVKNCGYHIILNDYKYCQRFDNKRPLYYDFYDKAFHMKTDKVPLNYDFYDYNVFMRFFTHSILKTSLHAKKFFPQLVKILQHNYYKNENTLIRNICATFVKKTKNIIVEELPLNAKVINTQRPRIIGETDLSASSSASSTNTSWSFTSRDSSIFTLSRDTSFAEMPDLPSMPSESSISPWSF